jgi:nicotinamidase-related amidase
VVPEDACASYFPAFHDAALRMIRAQGGIFGWTTDSGQVLTALNQDGKLDASRA